MPLTETDVIRIRQFLQKLKSGLIEGMDVYTTYHDSNLAATPSDPTGDGTTGGWHREPTEASNWMSVKTALKDTSGTWGTPIRVFGLQGTDTAGVGMSDDVPRLTQITFIGDGGSKVGWTAGTVEYGGNSYAIAAKAVGDASTDQFIYWDDADGQTSFKTTGTLATAIGANHHYVCRNDSGVATPAWIQRIILGGVIQGFTITADKILTYDLTAANATIENLMVKTAHIDNLSVSTGKIIGLAVETEKIADDATHITESAYTVGQVTVSSQVAIQTDSIDSQGGVVEIFGSVEIEASAGDVWYSIYLYRGSLRLARVAESLSSGATEAVTISASWVPGSGSRTFTLEAFRTSGAASFKAGKRSIQLKESLGK